VRDAPGDADRGLQTLTDAEKGIWKDAVVAYANGLSKKEPTSDEPLAALVSTLATVGNTAALKGVSVDANTRAILERAAPIYRKTWWPTHRATNRAYRAGLTPLIDRDGRAIIAFLTSRYGLPWASTPYQVHLSAYATWGAAFSTPGTDGQLIVVSTNAHSGTQGLSGLETVFHEAMHVWDDAVSPLLREQATAMGRTVPPGLTHALIFFTAGEAVRRVAPGYVTVGETEQMWTGIYMPFRAGWDQATFGTLAALARARNVTMPRDLPHAMIFFTAGEAVRRLDPNYIPVADAEGVWRFQLSGAALPAERLKPILEDVWKPFMNGRGTRDEALGALVERAAAVSR
jgi:hypothetical protein